MAVVESYRDYSPMLRKLVAAEVSRRVKAACILVQNHAKYLVSVDGTLKRGRGRITANGRKLRKGTLIYGGNPSAPGEPPHKQTGRLIGSITHEVDGLVGRVGTNLLYGLYLELGTSQMAARPWLRRALIEKIPEIKAIFGAPIRK